MRPRRQATCHGDKPHYAKGLCYSCYKKRLNKSNFSSSELAILNNLLENAMDCYVFNRNNETYRELENLGYKISRAIREQQL